MKGKLLAVDLFSGAGGLSLGFMQTEQVRIVAAVENNKSAQQTYIRNHGSQIKLFDDIRNLNYNDIIKECSKLGRTHVDLVVGGPPCQGFSNANRQKNELISTNNQLVKEYAKAIEKLQPKAFVMENVKAMKSSKHKFFYSSNEKVILNELGVKLDLEKVAIGNENIFSVELVEFLKRSILAQSDLSAYLINDTNLFSKLSLLSRKSKNLEENVLKIRKIIKESLNKWESVHTQYWSELYKSKWISLGKLFQQDNQSIKSLMNLQLHLKEIIEVQKIVRKINEIILNKVDISELFIENKNIFILVQTYNVLEYLFCKFKSLGYVLNENPLYLNAANFGVPQLRERLFLIGIKREFVRDDNVKLPSPILKNSCEFYTVKEAIEDLANVQPSTKFDNGRKASIANSTIENPLLNHLRADMTYVHNHVMTNTTKTALERFKMLEQGQNFHDLDESLKKTYSDPRRTQNTVYLRLKYNAPSGTVLNVRKSMWIHPQVTRAISIREAARLQSFPDSFIFEGSKDSQYQQIGNAVPPLLGRAVAEQVLRYLGKQVESSLAQIIKRNEKVLT